METLQRTRRDRSSSVLQSETNGGHNVVLDQDIDDEALGIFDEKRRDLDKSSPRINRTDDQENDLDAEDSSRRINNNGGAPRSTEVVDDMFKLSESSGVVGGGGGDNDNEGALEPVTVVPPIESVLATKGDQDEKILLQYLMRGYERDVRPVRNSSQPVVIEVGITLTQIFDMVIYPLSSSTYLLHTHDLISYEIQLPPWRFFIFFCCSKHFSKSRTLSTHLFFKG